MGELPKGDDELPCLCITTWVWVCSDGMTGWGDVGLGFVWVGIYKRLGGLAFTYYYGTSDSARTGSQKPLEIRIQIKIKVEQWLWGVVLYWSIRIGGLAPMRLTPMRLWRWRWRYGMTIICVVSGECETRETQWNAYACQPSGSLPMVRGVPQN